MSRLLPIAVAQYPIGKFGSLSDWRIKLSEWVRNAVKGGARLVVFPEYGAMELASLFPEYAHGNLQEQLRSIQDLLPVFIAEHRAMAKLHHVYILASSFPAQQADGTFVNRAHFFGPSGEHGFQDKRVMTRFEREKWGITGGGELKVFDIGLAKVGVAICYDAEFPQIVRAMVDAGANLILVPSCTDTMAGYYRVQIGARARALESQCFVAVSPTVGQAPWSAAVDENVGAAAVFAPPDTGMPENGVIKLGTINTPCWVHANLDMALVEKVRREGQVFNFAHWPEQSRPNLVVRSAVLK